MQIEHPSDPSPELSAQPDPKKPPPSKLEMKDFLSKGTYIDAKDSMNNWCVAIILDFFPKEDRITIRYDGWADRWNDVSFFS